MNRLHRFSTFARQFSTEASKEKERTLADTYYALGIVSVVGTVATAILGFGGNYAKNAVLTGLKLEGEAITQKINLEMDNKLSEIEQRDFR